MSLAMTEQERMAFLRGLHVGVVVVERPDRAPLALPIWYDVTEAGEPFLQTSPDSLKARLIEEAGRFALSVQDEAPPYKYVTVEGSVASVRPATMEGDLRPMARRYFGIEGGDAWLASVGDSETDNVVITMHPERWHTADFAKMQAAGD